VTESACMLLCLCTCSSTKFTTHGQSCIKREANSTYKERHGNHAVVGDGKPWPCHRCPSRRSPSCTPCLPRSSVCSRFRSSYAHTYILSRLSSSLDESANLASSKIQANKTPQRIYYTCKHRLSRRQFHI
jgi:hypothetical protein